MYSQETLEQEKTRLIKEIELLESLPISTTNDIDDNFIDLNIDNNLMGKYIRLNIISGNKDEVTLKILIFNALKLLETYNYNSNYLIYNLFKSDMLRNHIISNTLSSNWQDIRL